jgi:deazaflavin-dependent oxidoreductase (nitroreductase family)
MEQCPGYRRKLARAFTRIFRPLAPVGPLRKGLDRVTARWWTRFDVVAYRRTGISLGVRALGISDVLLLRTRGRVSGQVREVLLAYVELDGIPYICAANGGSDRAPAWLENLRGGAPVEIERRGRREAIAPVILDGEDRDRVFEAVYEAFPHVRVYLERTSRTFPVVRLEPRVHTPSEDTHASTLAVAVTMASSGALHQHVA